MAMSFEFWKTSPPEVVYVDRKSTRLNSSHQIISYAVFCLKKKKKSGIHWGLGSDATAVTPSNPFYTLNFAVTGKMVGGRQVNRQSISREDALVAHTRSNAL